MNLAKAMILQFIQYIGKGELEKELPSDIKVESWCDKKYAELTELQKHFIMPLKVLFFGKRKAKKELKGKYDVEISFLEGPITRMFSYKNENSKKIVWIHNDISKVFGSGIKAKLKRFIDKKIYSKYQDLIFVSKDNKEKFEKTYPEIKSRKQVIYNYINSKKVLEKAEEFVPEEIKEEKINLVTVTRLVKQKGIDRLIKVHSKLIKQGLNHEIFVIGDGPEKENLKNQIKEENVENTFHLLGAKQNPYPYVKHANYFCLLSYFEGYGMVLEEAKILNKKIIITDTAAREAVNGYNKAIILENEEVKIYQGLEKIIKNELEKNETIDKNEKQEEFIYNNSNIINEIQKLVGE